ncbi:MAG TPA: PVC-type heme-binding CxxCH protein [Pirellulales bacterium]|nr:PVC-type heme-binding CxxCH protein [Pirellulales bacterium]
MKPLRRNFALTALAATLSAVAAPSIAGETPLNGHVFTLPPGFVIEQVAGSPLVDRPIVADFDEQGRLYVADSSGSNENVQEQLAKKPHRIVRLEDTDGDGRFDESKVFAEGMMFPEGTMWLAGSLYVATPPSIWKLTDTDGDGAADERIEWFQGKTLTGCANDLHGPYAGPDGWIYWCKGAFAEQTYERPGRPPLVTRAAHIFRCRPDGSAIEPVMTGGMDNPVDVVFTPGGERIFTTTFLQHPAGGLRDGLIHAVYGGVYGKVHDVIEGHARTSPEVMPVLVHLGAAAPCGLTRYESDQFGPEYRDNLFAAAFNMQKITRHALTPEGGSFASYNDDFLVSSNHDFHPTDVLADADGSLLVVDTGGWYKLCCPTSQLHKPDLLGAVYRVRRSGAKPPVDPRGLRLPWANVKPDELARRLADARPAVRRRSIEALGRLGEGAVDALEGVVRKAKSADARRNAVWAATRIEGAAARGVVRAALADRDETVRQAAIHSASVWRDQQALGRLIELLEGDSAQNRRAAAEALGRLGDKVAVEALLAATATPADRAVEHSLTYALIEIADQPATAKGLASPNALTQRDALVALDQMPQGGLTAETVAPFLETPAGALNKTAAWIVGRHPTWGDELAGHFRHRLGDPALSAEERDELVEQLVRLAGSAAIQDLLASRLCDASAPQEERTSALAAVARCGLKDIPPGWIEALATLLQGDDRTLVAAVVTAVRAMSVSAEQGGTIKPALLKIAGGTDVPDELRVAALAAVPGGLTEVDAAVFAFLLDQLDSNELDSGREVNTRAAAVEVLSKARLNGEQLVSLAASIKDVGPLEIDRLLGAFEQSTDDAVGMRLLEALDKAPALSALRVETLKPHLAKFGAPVQERAEVLYAGLSVGAAEQKARLGELLASLPQGEVRRGQAIFKGTKAACASCHAIGYLGGRLGPDMTRIGQTRSDRDLLEAIVFPSASFVRSYESVLVVTQDGRQFSGLLRKDAPDEVVLVKSPTEEYRIARDEIEQMLPGTVSIMPQGLDQQLTLQELSDLVAFLRACK